MDNPATIPPSFFSFFRRRAPVELEKDEFGAIRPFSNDAIQLDLEGPAALIGDNPFAVVGGTGAVWIRAKEQPGSVRLTATHPVFGKKKNKCKLRWLRLLPKRLKTSRVCRPRSGSETALLPFWCMGTDNSAAFADRQDLISLHLGETLDFLRRGPFHFNDVCLQSLS